MLEWMMPMPPCNAMVMAILCSVMMSMGEDTNGTLTFRLCVSWLDSLTLPTPKEIWPGISMILLHMYAIQAAFPTKIWVGVYLVMCSAETDAATRCSGCDK